MTKKQTGASTTRQSATSFKAWHPEKYNLKGGGPKQSKYASLKFVSICAKGGRAIEPKAKGKKFTETFRMVGFRSSDLGMTKCRLPMLGFLEPGNDST